jgi:hypothetical protein
MATVEQEAIEAPSFSPRWPRRPAGALRKRAGRRPSAGVFVRVELPKGRTRARCCEQRWSRIGWRSPRPRLRGGRSRSGSRCMRANFSHSTPEMVEKVVARLRARRAPLAHTKRARRAGRPAAGRVLPCGCSGCRGGAEGAPFRAPPGVQGTGGVRVDGGISTHPERKDHRRALPAPGSDTVRRARVLKRPSGETEETVAAIPERGSLGERRLRQTRAFPAGPAPRRCTAGPVRSGPDAEARVVPRHRRGMTDQPLSIATTNYPQGR